MRVSRLLFLAIAMVLFTVPATVLADTYKAYDLGSANNGTGILGITASGSVVIYWQNTWETWTNGVVVSSSTSDPGLVYDNGAACTPTVSPAIGSDNVLWATCNGSREVYGTDPYAPAPYADSIFAGPDPSDFVANHEFVEPFVLNASGDFAFVADQALYPSDGEIFEYVDLTTAPVPEPGSLLLFCMGALALAGFVRRRPSRAVQRTGNRESEQWLAF